MASPNPTEARLIEAARQGNLPLVQQLSKVCMTNMALDEASAYGHLEVMDFLLPLCDPKDKESFVLRWAASNGEDKAVEKLLPYTDSRANDSEALRWGSSSGNVRVVQLLAPHSDVLASDCDALASAVYEGSLDIVDYLLPFHTIEHLRDVKERLNNHPGAGLFHLGAVIRSWEENAQLSAAVEENQAPTRPIRRL